MSLPGYARMHSQAGGSRTETASAHADTRALAAILATVFLTACGGGGGDSPTTPTGPVAVASVTISPATLDLVAGDTARLTAQVKGEDGSVLTDRTVTFASSDSKVATVSSDGLVTGVAEGSATISAASEGKSGSSSATVAWPAFNPTQATQVSGDHTYSSLTIAQGVTVTLSADATLTSEGAVDISGEVSGDCMAVTVIGSTVSVTGKVANTCSAATEAPPGLRIVSQGDLTVDGATIQSSGDVELTNDTTLLSLSDSAFAEMPSTVASSPVGPARAAAAHTCTVKALVPVKGGVTKGRTGKKSDTQGGDGAGGGNWMLACRGNVNITGEGGGVIDTPDGGDGGNGSDTNVNDPNKKDVTGGKGGDGGRVRIRATGNINFPAPPAGQPPFKIMLANGGRGGDASMTATSDGGSAAAFGGDGGTSGTLNVRANGGITIGAGGLEIVVGDGGRGGDATAIAADGADATAATAAQAGGSATATGGKGGDTPKAQLTARGNVVGAMNVTLSGGDGGDGGDASAHGGNGGNGSQAFPDGAVGGAMDASGGDGGSARAKDVGGSLVGLGGDGGDSYYSGGDGGHGFDGCGVTPQQAGGAGGIGGNALGVNGKGGTGNANGLDGLPTVADGTGNGGNGGDGDGPGQGGSGGADQINSSAAPQVDPTASFQDGAAGHQCRNWDIDISSLPTTFTHTVGVTACPTLIGSFTITNTSASAGLQYSVSTTAPLGLRIKGSSTSATTQEGTVPAGSSVTIEVIFDCSQTTSFTRDVSISVSSPAGSEGKTVTITGTVK